MKTNINNLFIFIQNKNNNSVIEFLNKTDIDLKDELGRTSLLNAAFCNNVDLMKWLIENGADINATDNEGYTALHFAAQEAHEDSLNLLVKNKADLNIQDEHGNTPAWVCIMN